MHDAVNGDCRRADSEIRCLGDIVTGLERRLKEAREAISVLLDCHDEHRKLLEDKDLMSQAHMCKKRGDAWRVYETLFRSANDRKG